MDSAKPHDSFVLRLASNDLKVRTRTLDALRVFFKTKTEFTDLDFMKICKGLHYAFWMSDKVDVQHELADKISLLIHSHHPENAYRFTKAFWAIMDREWITIDSLRTDKYLTLIRKMVTQCICYLREHNYEASLVDELVDQFGNQMFEVNTEITQHFCDIYVEEIYKALGLEVPAEVIQKLIVNVLIPPVTREIDPLVVAKVRIALEDVVKAAFNYEYDDITSFPTLSLLDCGTACMKYAAQPDIHNRHTIYAFAKNFKLCGKQLKRELAERKLEPPKINGKDKEEKIKEKEKKKKKKLRKAKAEKLNGTQVNGQPVEKVRKGKRKREEEQVVEEEVVGEEPAVDGEQIVEETPAVEEEQIVEESPAVEGNHIVEEEPVMNGGGDSVNKRKRKKQKKNTEDTIDHDHSNEDDSSGKLNGKTESHQNGGELKNKKKKRKTAAAADSSPKLVEVEAGEQEVQRKKKSPARKSPKAQKTDAEVDAEDHSNDSINNNNDSSADNNENNSNSHDNSNNSNSNSNNEDNSSETVSPSRRRKSLLKTPGTTSATKRNVRFSAENSVQEFDNETSVIDMTAKKLDFS